MREYRFRYGTSMSNRPSRLISFEGLTFIALMNSTVMISGSRQWECEGTTR